MPAARLPDRQLQTDHSALPSSAANRLPGVFDTVPARAVGSMDPNHIEHDVLAVTPPASFDGNQKSFGGDCGGIIAITCSTSLVPMPKASAPKRAVSRGVASRRHRRAG